MSQYEIPKSSPEDVAIDASQAEAIAREDEQILKQQIGARMLRAVGYADKIPASLHDAESTFAKNRKRLHNERVPKAFNNGESGERKLMLHLDALEKAISAGGSVVEQSILDEIIHGDPDANIPGIHISTMEDIPDSYWRSQEEAYRDNGHIIHYDARLKSEELEIIQREQVNSIELWESYLQHESCPYPMWFKLYALDGISKMGKYDKSRGEFVKRDNTTVAPYPKLDEASLAKVFQSIVDFYSLGDKSTRPQKQGGEADEELTALIKSGNFNKLYTKFLSQERYIIEVPKNPENIHGEWIEYNPGDEEKLAKAADCTPWCIVSPSVAHNYLEYGNYEGIDMDDYNNYDDYENRRDNGSSNRAKFILFHLVDPSTSEISGSGCASIRLGTDGRVAEISGLQKGQALDDSLVGIVEEKVMSLPGGEKFLEAFKDKKRLIKIDHKWRRGEELTEEDITFINGPIHTLDTYNDEDPRVTFIKTIAIPLQNGEDIDEIVGDLDSYTITENLDALLEHHANVDNIVYRLDREDTIEKFDTLLEYHADINNLVNNLHSKDIIEKLDTLLAHNANIDNIVNHLDNLHIIKKFDTLLEHHANIDNIVSHLDSFHIIEKFNTLLAHGANIDNIVNHLYDGDDTIEKFNALLAHGANIDNIVNRLHGEDVIKKFDALLAHGANIDNIVSHLNSKDIVENLDTLLEHHADVDNLVNNLHSKDIIEKLDTLLAHNANIDNIVNNLDSGDIVKKIDTLLEHHANIDNIIDRFYFGNIDILVNNLPKSQIAEKVGTLLAHGADRSLIDSKLGY